MLNLMYITNRSDVAMIAEAAGVDRIFVDLEYIGKADRQRGLNTVKSKHTCADVQRIADVLETAELIVRVNPMHEAGTDYCSSREEIENVLSCGAEILMLPYFKTVREVENFISIVQGRAKVMLLVETPEAVACVDSILALNGIDEIHIGLNDLSLGYGKSFMFDLLCDGTVEKLCNKFAERGIPYGFGGIAALGKGLLPAEIIIAEHYRLGSSRAILSRSFCNTDLEANIGKIAKTFMEGVRAIRDYESEIGKHLHFFENNKRSLQERIAMIHTQNALKKS